MKFLVTRCCSATRAPGLVPLPPIVGSICKLDIPASFWRRLLTCPAKPCARTEFASRLAGGAFSAVFSRGGGIIKSARGEGGADVDFGFRRDRGAVKLKARVF